MNNHEGQEEQEPLLSILSDQPDSVEEVVPATTIFKYFWVVRLLIWLSQVGFNIFLLVVFYDDEVYRLIFIVGISFTGKRTIFNIVARCRGSTHQHWWTYLCLIVDSAFSLVFFRLWAYPLKGFPGGLN
jgi:hypothetical protein